MGKGPAILCDFDGTVTIEEVSTSLLDRFAKGSWRNADRDLLSGRMTLRDTMAREFGLLKAPREEMEAFVQGIHIRKGFPALVDQARAHNAPLCIISEGLDFYIEAFLKSNGIEVQYRTNHAVFPGADGKPGITVAHPYSSGRCFRCGTCKTAQLAGFRRNGYTTVYIGDGISDRCPSRHADILFARNGLLRYCQNKNIHCIPYRDFNDVLREVRRLFWMDPPARKYRFKNTSDRA